MWHRRSSRRGRVRLAGHPLQIESRCTWRSFAFLARAASRARRSDVPGIGVLVVVIAWSPSAGGISAHVPSIPYSFYVAYESVLLQRIDEFIGELDGVFTARKVVSSFVVAGDVAAHWSHWRDRGTRTARRHAASRPKTVSSSLHPLLCWRSYGCAAR
jgi:hypothetical protein